MEKRLLQEKIQKETLLVLENYKQASVELGTGVGKTLLGLKHMVKHYTDYCSFLVIVPKLTVKDSWLSEIKTHGYEFLIEHIQFTTYRSLNKASVKYDWTYADECHNLTDSHANWLTEHSRINGNILGLTGTYPKRGSKKELCDEFIPKVFEYSIDEGTEAGMLNDYRIYVHMLELSNKPTLIKKNKSGGRWKTSELKDYYGLNSAIDKAFGKKKLMMRLYRMKSMQQYDTKVNYVKDILKKIPVKTLIFANTKEQADIISKHSVYSKHPRGKENLKDFSDGKIYRLSCVEQLSESININDLQVGIIMHAFSNDTKTRQKIGRFLRLVVNKKAKIHILCYKNTIDETWVKNALESFDQSKIKYHTP